MAIEGRTDPIDEGMLRAINCAFDAGDCDEICLAIGIVLQKRNVSEVARASGTKRETIHRTFLSGQTISSTTEAFGGDLGKSRDDPKVTM